MTDHRLNLIYYPYQVLHEKSLFYSLCLYFDEVSLIRIRGGEIKTKEPPLLRTEDDLEALLRDVIKPSVDSLREFIKFEDEIRPLLTSGLVNFVQPDPTIAERAQRMASNEETMKLIRDFTSAFPEIAHFNPFHTAPGIEIVAKMPHFAKEEYKPIIALLTIAHLFSPEKLGCIPFTDDEFFLKLLCLFLLTHKGKSPILSDNVEANLASRVIAQEIPNLGFKNADQVLRARELLQDDFLLPFRAAISDISAEVQYVPFSKSYVAEVDRLLTEKIRPQLKRMEEEIRRSRNKLWRDVARNVLFAAPISFMLNVHVGIPLWASTAAGAATASGLAFLEAIDQSRAIEAQNGLTYLFKLRKRLT